MFSPLPLSLARFALFVFCTVLFSFGSAYSSNGSDGLAPHESFSIIFSNNTTADYKACG